MRSFDCLIGWQAHVGEVCSMQFSADETTAYSMGTDGKVTSPSNFLIIFVIYKQTAHMIYGLLATGVVFQDKIW